MANKINVLLLQNEISHYREELYNELSKYYNLTIAYDKNDRTSENVLFSKILYKSYKIGPFVIFNSSLYKDIKKYDVIITINDLHQLSFCLLPFLPYKNKFICWSMGIRASYTRPYILDRKHTLLDKAFAAVMNKCDAMIFYMDEAKKFWDSREIDMEKVFTAINTVPVKYINMPLEDKSDFLFIGTLYKQKGVDRLIINYAEVMNNVQTNSVLHIVGDGDQKQYLIDLTKQLNIEKNVVFHGAIFDEDKIAMLFAKSILCLSPTQAGLSVPKSLGYGVPFVTNRRSITGGEIFHIKDNVTGIKYDSDEDLKSILIDVFNNKNKYIKMGESARNYYLQKASINHMAQGFIDAINFALYSR